MFENPRTDPDINARIIDKAKASGASLAGIASVAALKNSPSYEICDKSPYYEGYEKVEWPEDAKSVLVLALVHESSEAELDYWDYELGRTPGNRQLASIAGSLKQWMNKELSINARLLWWLV